MRAGLAMQGEWHAADAQSEPYRISPVRPL